LPAEPPKVGKDKDPFCPGPYFNYFCYMRYYYLNSQKYEKMKKRMRGRVEISSEIKNCKLVGVTIQNKQED
jgi:hypothetical protein